MLRPTSQTGDDHCVHLNGIELKAPDVVDNVLVPDIRASVKLLQEFSDKPS